MLNEPIMAPQYRTADRHHSMNGRSRNALIPDPLSGGLSASREVASLINLMSQCYVVSCARWRTAVLGDRAAWRARLAHGAPQKLRILPLSSLNLQNTRVARLLNYTSSAGARVAHLPCYGDSLISTSKLARQLTSAAPVRPRGWPANRRGHRPVPVEDDRSAASADPCALDTL